MLQLTCLSRVSRFRAVPADIDREMPAQAMRQAETCCLIPTADAEHRVHRIDWRGAPFPSAPASEIRQFHQRDTAGLQAAPVVQSDCRKDDTRPQGWRLRNVANVRRQPFEVLAHQEQIKLTGVRTGSTQPVHGAVLLPVAPGRQIPEAWLQAQQRRLDGVDH